MKQYQNPGISIEIFSAQEILTDILSASNGIGITDSWNDLIGEVE